MMRLVSLGLFVVCLFSGCALTEGGDETAIHKLPAMEVKGDHFTPSDGIQVDAAKDLIIEDLVKDGVQGDIDRSIEIEEISTREAWENNAIQLYFVTLPYAAVYGVAVVTNGAVVAFLSAMSTEGLYLADLNGDGKYEVCTVYDRASGTVALYIEVFDVKNSKQYEMPAGSNDEDYLRLAVDDDDNLIVVTKPGDYIVDSPKSSDKWTLLGRLILKDDELVTG